MRHFLCVLFLLTACQMTAPVDTIRPGVSPLANDAIAVTTLDNVPQNAKAATNPVPTAEAVPVVTKAGPNTPHPKPRPVTKPDAKTVVAKPVVATQVETPQPDATPVVPPSPQQVLCEKSGGQWATAGETGANLCVKRMKDAGKRCSQKGDCKGQCLARSQTCSPIDPMIGCNDILEGDGRRVTLCLN